MPDHFIVDTDIGTDVDDAIALMQIIGSKPTYNLSVTTVYGDVRKRAQIAANYCRLMNSDIAIFPGESKTISGKAVWTSGLEGSLHRDLEARTFHDSSAFEHMQRLFADRENSVEVLAIAPLTNLAKAIVNSATPISNLRKVYLMGGRFAEGKNEHNIACDITAAQEVLHSNLRIDVVGIEITSQLQMNLGELNSVLQLGPAGLLLHEEITQWAGYWNRDWIVPHDSVAFLMKSSPELFEFSNLGEIKVMDDGQTVFFENPSGRKRIVKKMDIEGARTSIMSSLERVRFSL